MKKQLLLYAIALLVSGPGATAAVEYEGYTNPAGDKFPIAIFDNVPINATKNGQPLTEAEQKAYFDDIKKCGFNVELWDKGCSLNYMPLMNKWTHYLKELDMGIILNSQGYCLTRSSEPGDANTPYSVLLKDNWTALGNVMNNHRQNPDVWGFHVMDEPSPRNWDLPVYQLKQDEVAAIPTFDMVNTNKGSKIAYANFVGRSNVAYIGHFATDNPGNSYVENFENYLDYMVDLFNLKFLTFDLYPVISNYEGCKPDWIIRPFYYNMMDLYGRYCRDRKIPIWLVMLSVEHLSLKANGSLDWEYPEITEGLLRLQAMNGLAFGMKGLAYWRYGSQGERVGNTLYKTALYDINKMEKTPAWNAAKSVNYDVAQYGRALQNATYDRSCIVVNDSGDGGYKYEGFERFSKPFYGVTNLINSGHAVLISHLTDGDCEYLAIVNQDYFKSQSIDLSFDPKYKYDRFWLTYPADANDLGLIDIDKDLVKYETFRLGPGEMRLYVRNNKKN